MWYAQTTNHMCPLSLTCFFCLAPLLKVTTKSFKFAAQYDLDFHFVSAADGTNVVKV